MNEKDTILKFLRWTRKNHYIQGRGGWFLCRQLNHGLFSDSEMFEIYKNAGKNTR